VNPFGLVVAKKMAFFMKAKLKQQWITSLDFDRFKPANDKTASTRLFHP